MSLICFNSPKGGVGRTTLCATLGVALHRLGWRVLAVDLDRQNALRLNFELPEELRGIVDDRQSAGEWREFVVATPAGIDLLPFGAATAAGAMRLHSQAAQNPDWLRDRLRPLLDERDLLVVIDMPAGPSAFHADLEPLADLHLVALLADAMSLALLPRLQHGDYLFTQGAPAGSVGYILNQVDARRQLCRDVLAFSRDVLGGALYGVVHQDEGVAEAAACQLTVLDYAPDSVATQDMMAIARRINGTLVPG